MHHEGGLRGSHACVKPAVSAIHTALRLDSMLALDHHHLVAQLLFIVCLSACLHTIAGHPHVVQVVDALEDHSHVHIVMELCSGGDLVRVLSC